jgi:hypothetical protein
MKNLLPFVFLVVSVAPGFSQTTLNTNPPSLRWYQVNTPHFRVLFPNGFEAQAQRMANTLEHIHAAEAKSLGTVPKKISIVLQNQSALSNGFVTILPRHSEFYAMPPQNYNFSGTNDWLNLLASHEYRHIVQYQHATRGFTRAFYYLFGSTTLAGLAQAAAPMWFWEGDAVATETAFTPSGRGRIPNFSLLFKTNLLEGREFNYHKQYLRSYKHNIPDHYVLGYHMVSYLRKRTNDPQIWGKVTARSWNVPFIPLAFSNALKKETGLYVTGLYREMVKDYKQQWQQELAQLEFTSFEKVNSRNAKRYIDYEYPQPLEDGSVLAMKRGIGDIETFVVIKNGEEKKVFTPGYINDAGMLSVVNNRIVWNEYGYDPRWSVRNYSLIKSFDIPSGKKRVISAKHERLGSAALSPDGDRIAAVRTDTEYKTTLVVLDLSTGKIIQEFPNPENHFYSMPRWSADPNIIAVLKTTPEGKTITLVNVSSETYTDILPVRQENLGHPVMAGEFVLYNSPVSGIDNLYAVKISTGEKFQVTSSRYGAYNPSVSNDGKTLYYNDQTKNGLDIVKIPFNPSSWKPHEEKQQDPVNDYSHLVEQEGDPDLFKTIPQQQLSVTRYSKLRGVINPYTWGFNIENDLTKAQVGIASKDILSTTAINLGWVFDPNERTSSWQASVSYQGLFPIIDVTASTGNRKIDEGSWTYQRVVRGDTVTFEDNLTFEWKETTIEGGLRIPLITTKSRFSSAVTLSDHVGYKTVRDFSNTIDGGGRIVPIIPGQGVLFREYVDQGSLVYNHFGFTAYRLLKQSRRDINSKWGQRVVINVLNTPFGGNYSAGQFSGYGILYFPGLFKHHSLWGYFGYQHTQIVQERDNYTFSNRIPLPRGLSVSRLVDFYSMSANYTLPVWYPDIALGPVVNVQRLRANLFADHGFGESRIFNVSRTYTSVGAEVKLDLNIFRFFPQFDIGVRYSEGLQPATRKIELLIGTFNF